MTNWKTVVPKPISHLAPIRYECPSCGQITILPAGNASYEFDIFYLGTWIAQITEIEQFNTLDTSIDLTACVAGVCQLCGDAVVNGGEECDDGNTDPGDGCDASCLLE